MCLLYIELSVAIICDDVIKRRIKKVNCFFVPPPHIGTFSSAGLRTLACVVAIVCFGVPLADSGEF